MSPLLHEDLVGYALGGLDAPETERIRLALEADVEGARGLEAIREHLAVHASLPSLEPSPSLWRSLEARMAGEATSRPFLRRFWRPLAAAALLLVALFAPRPDAGPVPEIVHGHVAPAPGNLWTSTGVSRIRLGDGVTVTLDDRTTVEPLAQDRLALRAGRVFLDVEKGRLGYVVEACGQEVVTTGTRFAVDAGRGYLKVLVEEGTVRCGDSVIGPGQVLAGGRVLAQGFSFRDWFSRPILSARILDETTVRVVFRNEMPDPILLAPPVGGGPFCYLSYGGHDFPVTPEKFDAPLSLNPDTEQSFDLRLPRPLGDREALFVSHPLSRLRVEATR